MKQTEYIGWDVGGAHLKIARISADGELTMVTQLATPLWKGYERLERALIDVCNQLHPNNNAVHALTMTAELADIFDNRNVGLKTIIDTFATRFNRHLRIYAGRTGLVSVNQAHEYYADIASANWYATAEFAARYIDDAMLIDIGSTTTDITRILSGKIRNRGYSDQERLRANELVYTGVIRTPIMSLTDSVPFAGQWQGLAAEHFATCADIYRITGELNEEDDLAETADARGKTLNDSIRRLARMLGADANSGEDNTMWVEVARYLAEQQVQKIYQGLSRILSYTPVCSQTRIIGAGCGRFLVKKLALRCGLEYVDFMELLDVNSEIQATVSRCAPAVAVAYLVRDNSE